MIWKQRIVAAFSWIQKGRKIYLVQKSNLINCLMALKARRFGGTFCQRSTVAFDRVATYTSSHLSSAKPLPSLSLSLLLYFLLSFLFFATGQGWLRCHYVSLLDLYPSHRSRGCQLALENSRFVEVIKVIMTPRTTTTEASLSALPSAC